MLFSSSKISQKIITIFSHKKKNHVFFSFVNKSPKTPGLDRRALHHRGGGGCGEVFVPKKCDGPVPVPNVDGEVLAMVLKWGKKHDDEDDEEELRKWDAGFVRDLAPACIHKLITAADYLGDRDDLVDLLAGKVADMIKGKTSEQIRQMFRIANDFTPEEEEEFRRKNFWAFCKLLLLFFWSTTTMEFYCLVLPFLYMTINLR